MGGSPFDYPERYLSQSAFFHLDKVTTPGTLLGTLEYMAPEQTQDASAVDIRADIYGLGGTLYWALTGQPPFQNGGSMVEAVARRVERLAAPNRACRPAASRRRAR